MTLIVAIAVICAAVLAYVLHPAMTGGNRKSAWGLMAGLAAAALGLYLMLGSPDLPSAPALFEQGPRHAMRLAVEKKMMLQELDQGGAASPE
ncbi:MAG TPA: hypothetical protein VIF12_07355 [Micavibrio sp.]|jgi:hypothetical protein